MEQRIGGAREPVSTVKSPRHTSESSGPLAAIDPQELLAHSEWLKGFARALVRNEAEAEDLAQEAMGVLASTTRKVRDLRAYLKGTVRHLALKSRRQAVRSRDREVQISAERPQEVSPSSEVTERMDLMRAVLEEVGHLPESQARVIGLRFLEDLTVSEIAEQAGLQPSSVRSTLSRGLERLRARLDGRFDGRDAWTAVLAPWALPFPLPTGAADAVSEAGSSSQGIFPNVAPKGAPALAPAAALGLAMSFKTISIVTALLVATFGAWRVFSGPEADLVPISGPILEGDSPVADARPDAVEAGLAPAPVDSETRVATGEVASPTSPATSAGPARTTLAGIFVDAITGEAIPELSVRFRYLENRRPRITEYILSDRTGRFGSQDHSVPSEGLTISVVDNRVGAQKLNTEDFELPTDGLVPIEVGPTFTLLPMGVPVSGLVARKFKALASGPGIRANDPIETKYAPKERDWIRFGRPFGDSDDEGPWSLRLESADGLMVGTGQLGRRVGIEAAPISVSMEPRGALEFTLDTGGAALPDFCTVEVESEHPGAPVSVDLAQEAGSMKGRLKFLQPGTYRWSLTRGTKRETGEVQVRELALESVTVRLPSDETWQPRVILDASGAPAADVTAWPAQLLRLDGSNKNFEVKIERVGPESAGQFEARIDSLPAGDWSFAVMAPPGFTADPMLVPVERNGDPPTIRISVAERADVSLTFVDADTNEPLKVMATHFDGIKGELVQVSKEGAAEFSASASHPTYFIAYLDGYRMAKVPFEPGVHSTELRVALEKGWSNRVWVLDAATQGPVEGAGLILDGESIGKTDAAGEIWLEGDSPPDLIELDEATKQRYKVLMSSFSKDGIRSGSGDPRGYVFLLTAK